MKDVTPAELSKDEAQKLTTRIKGAVDGLWKLLVKARDGKAFKALGYETWEAYVKAEFGMSDRHSRRLLEQGEVIAAIEDATGPIGPVSEFTARTLKDDLPAATAEIRERVEKGEKPEDAAKDIAAKKRADKEAAKAAKKAEKEAHERLREENRAKLPPAIQAQQEAKEEAIAARQSSGADGLTDADRIAELEEAVKVLEAENAALKAENKLFSEMKVEWENGGFAEVIAGKDEVISVQATRIERESADKVSWKRSADHWKAEAIKLGYGEDDYIDIPGRAVNA